MENLPRFLTRLHVTGRVGDELAEGYFSVLQKGIPSRFWSFTLRNLHRFRIVIDDLCIRRRDSALLDGNAQHTRKDRLGGRGQRKMLLASSSVVPLGDKASATNNDDAVTPVANVVVKPLFCTVKFPGIYTHIRRRRPLPFSSASYCSHCTVHLSSSTDTNQETFDLNLRSTNATELRDKDSELTALDWQFKDSQFAAFSI